MHIVEQHIEIIFNALDIIG